MRRSLVALVGIFSHVWCFAGTPYDIGVLDTGIVDNDSVGLSRINSQLCISASDIQIGDNFS